MADSVQVFEVGLRDGLQNESKILGLEDKLWLMNALVRVGMRQLEVGAFVRPDRVPQMADTDEIYEAIHAGRVDLGRAHAWALVPNRKGLERALRVGATHLAVFTAATQSFAQANIGMSIQESLDEFRWVIQEARKHLGRRIKVRGYVSTAFGCPFEGKVKASQALKVIEKLSDLGVDQISVGDTIGVADPRAVSQLLKPLIRSLGKKMLAVHFHDTRGTALANSLRALDLGVRVIDSSIGGLGGCPFAPGASGNLATEDLVYMLNGMGMKTGIELQDLCQVSLRLSEKMSRPLSSRYLQSFASQCERKRLKETS